MREFAEVYPEAQDLLALHHEEVAALIVKFWKARNRGSARQNDGMIVPSNAIEELWPYRGQGYPHEMKPQVVELLTMAWKFAEREFWALPAEGINGANGWRVLSSMAEHVDAPDISFGRSLNQPVRKFLHPLIEKEWVHVQRGEFGTAVRNAFVKLEDRIRTAADLLNGDVPKILCHKAFQQKTGKLTDPNSAPGKQDATASLFAGAFGVFRNEASHSELAVSSLAEAVEQLLLVSTLLRIVDRAGERKSGLSKS